MSFELLPGIQPWVIGYLVLAVLATLLAITSAATALLANRRVRVGRQQSIPAYYGALAFSH
ncbi:hypothetical protein BJ980_001236 [Nocardioides daedukensis]|uniref:Uncharacterized protein n=1 Tax=Nocardioides daedukensis TaxID=634462 RepID=A0A7Y9S197_9ACTN|nr:hypothetical protein [Nocardioides daedukensis]NYG58313.1 hypothetical protein [Nocardioides daedukensis]